MNALEELILAEGKRIDSLQEEWENFIKSLGEDCRVEKLSLIHI